MISRKLNVQMKQNKQKMKVSVPKQIPTKHYSHSTVIPPPLQSHSKVTSPPPHRHPTVTPPSLHRHSTATPQSLQKALRFCGSYLDVERNTPGALEYDFFKPPLAFNCSFSKVLDFMILD
jgi:hypothetical protein